MTKVYVINGMEEVATLKEVAEVLGLPRVAGKDVEAGKYPEVEIRYIEDDVEEVAEVEETTEDQLSLQDIADATDNVEIIMVGDAPAKALTNEEELPTEEDTEVLTNVEDTDEVLTDEEEPTTVPHSEPSLEEEVEEEVEEEGIEYPEVGYFEDEKAMKKYIKKLSNQELQEWCELEGAEWKPNDHEAIHFPDTAPKKGKSKKKSKYADYTTEDLVQMAIDNDVEVRDDKGDMRILRMYTIMALKEAGLLA